MKNSTITLLSIFLWISLAVGILLAAGAGFLYMGAMMWESGWVKGEAIDGPDGYTYCLMHETGIGQDPHTRLIRTKDIWDEETFEILGETNTTFSWVKVIRPFNSKLIIKGPLSLTSNRKIFMTGYLKRVAFVYDIDNDQFYDDYGETEASPFILLEENSDLYVPDVIWLISIVAEDKYSDLKPEVLKIGLSHPNKEVQQIAGWLLEIQEKGFSRESETIHDLIKYLEKHKDCEDSKTRECIRDIFTCTGWEELKADI